MASKSVADEIKKMKPFKIRDIEINPPLILSPMAGVTDYTFRRLMKRRGGVGLVVSEFISVEGLTRTIRNRNGKCVSTKRTPVCRPDFRRAARTNGARRGNGAGSRRGYSRRQLRLSRSESRQTRRRFGAFEGFAASGNYSQRLIKRDHDSSYAENARRFFRFDD
jgi:hypothetical protein